MGFSVKSWSPANWAKVHFDHVDPRSNAATDDARRSLAHLDYSPLQRVSARSFSMAVLISMGGLIFGYDTGQISGFLEMPDFQRRFGEYNAATGAYTFSNVRSGLIVAMLSIGTLIGALCAAPIADAIGRRLSMTFWALIFMVGLIVQISTDNHWYQIMMGRWVAGLGVGALSVLVPLYQGETAPRYIRGALISCYQLFITLGIFLAACFNFGLYEHQRQSNASWRVPIGIGFLFGIVLAAGILLFPETPRFDYRKGRTEEAKQTMMRVHNCPPNHYVIHAELEEIEAKLKAERAVKGTFIDEVSAMMAAPKVPYRLVLGISLQALQQLTGANFFFYYSTGINNSFVTQMILNGINFGVTFIGLYIVEHYGRRRSLVAGAIWMFVCFMVFASVGHFGLDRDTPTNTPAAGTAMIVFACLFILGYATTWGPMVWTIIAELYPNRFRAKGISLATASNWLWNFLIAFFSPFITGAIDFRYGYVFAACNVLAGLVVYFFVMEGQGRTLEEIDTMYISGVKPWNSTNWVAPTAAEIAQIRKEAGTADAAVEEGMRPSEETAKEKPGDDGPIHRE
ncbi:general substrate transporter [Pseudovirgaria hyperparasitica]|uniref:General substrate transporter n=1 Tax=Pseudovirgaria hyperparasitica TaxID=470096 RepID=A0A6A6VVE3_9PEZI|nr:general substrate transporter [Pseudovirgaria hyperparasitica]KAF2754135.1 general substrate transporter [Pseudovirgaria hyperparasitica]